MRIAFINEKGGTGKTTLAVHFAAWLATARRKPVIIVDLDPQGQVGKTLGFPARPEGPTVADLLESGSTLRQDCIRDTAVPRLKVILSDKQLAEAAESWTGKRGADLRLQTALEGLPADTTVIFDSPPSLGLLTRNVLWAANQVVVPVQLTYLALDGCAEIVQTIARVREARGGSDPRLAAMVPTFARRTRMAAEVLGRLKQYFPEAVTRPMGYAVAIDEAQSYGQTIWQHQPKSRAAEMLRGVCRDVAARLDGNPA